MQDDSRRNPPTPNSAARDKTEGTLREAGGRVKESAGALSGNDRLAAEGRADQAAGAARRTKGNWKDRIKAWIDRR